MMIYRYLVDANTTDVQIFVQQPLVFFSRNTASSVVNPLLPEYEYFDVSIDQSSMNPVE